MEKKKFALLVKICSVASACAIFTLALVAFVQFIQIGAANRKKAKIKNQISYVAQQSYDLKATIAQQKDASNAERYAREQLGFIEDGDIVYEVE